MRAAPALLLCCAASAQRSFAAGTWEKVGPRNVFDDKTGNGEAGTLATAASPASNPSLIYVGGQNNGASSGVLKTTDGGQHWIIASNGLFDTRVDSVHIHPGDPTGDHVLCGTPSGIYETTDGAASWKLINETTSFGYAHSFRDGNINGEPYVLAGTDQGIANVPVKGGTWNIIKTPKSWTSPLSVAPDGSNTAVAGCLSYPGSAPWGGAVTVGTIKSPTDVVDWQVLADPLNSSTKIYCYQVALDPKNKDHFIFSNSSGGDGHNVWGSTDGGKTTTNVDASTTLPVRPYYVAVDEAGWFYTAGMSGAFYSADGGKTWGAYYVNMTSKTTGKIDDRLQHDYQRIVVDFAGTGVAFPSDQGLFIKPHGSSNTLINACGDMSNNIAIGLAVSEGGGDGKNYLVTSAWDWGPLASWNSGADWPLWDCPDCGDSPSVIGEGGAAYSMGKSNHVVITHSRNAHYIDYTTIYYSSHGGKNFTYVDVAAGGNLPGQKIVGGLVYTRTAGSRTEPDGAVYTVMQKQASTSQESAAERGEKGDVDDDDDADDDGGRLQCGEQHDVHGCMAFGIRSSTSSLDSSPSAKYVLKSMNFGQNWTSTQLPASLQSMSGFSVDPTDPGTLYAVAPDCLSRSTDKGETWQACATATGLEGSFSSLVIKDSKTMIMLRDSDVPLRTKDGGASWQALPSCANITSGYSRAGSYSWTGTTLVMHGSDKGAPSRGQYGSYVWKSTDDGDSWTDETGDIVTLSLGSSIWYNKDFYLTSGGQGILAKRGFEE